MAAMIRIGLLAMLLVTVAANFEFDAEKHPGQYKAVVAKKRALDSTLVNGNVDVLFKRKIIPGKRGIRFVVSNNGIGNNANERDTYDSQNTDLCKGRPKLSAILSKNTKPVWQTIGNKKRNAQDFCLQAMHLRVLKKDFGPHMRVIVRFQNPESKETIGVEVHAYKPPKNEGHETQLRVDSPIPLPEFDKPSLQSTDESDYKHQSFISNISWIKYVLPRAKYVRDTRTGEEKHYAEWYMAGPVIIKREAFNKILSLDKDFDKLSSGEDAESSP